MSPAAQHAVQHAVNSLVSVAATVLAGYFGLIAPNEGAREAQWTCCALAHELREDLKACRP